MRETAKETARIAYFSDAPWFGGAERYLDLLARGLDRKEFEPALIMNRNPRLEALKDSMKRAGIGVREVSLDLARSFAGARSFVSVLREMRPAILHCNLPGPWSAQYSLVAPLARYAGVRHIVTTEHLPMVPPFAKGSALKRVGTAFVSRVITVSEDNVRYLVEYHQVARAKIRVVRIGIPDPEIGTAGAPAGRSRRGEGSFRCVMVGSLEERKGHATAFEAMARLGDGVELYVVGAGESEGALRAKAAELGLGARVSFLGYRADVDAILRTADVLLVPSRLEATPFVIVEAMAAGLPVIASRIYGIPELVLDGESGILVAAEDGEALARAIASLSVDPARAEGMGLKGRARYRELFTLERCVAGTTQVYRELVGGGGAGRERA